MRVLVFCQYYYPERFLINEIAPELVKRGHEVTVITGTPNYPEGKIYAGYESGKRRKERVEGVKVIRCNIIPRGKGKPHLLLNYLSYMYKATLVSRKLVGDYDVVFLYQLTPILQAYPAIKYAEKKRKKLLCYCLDLAPASGEDVAGKLHILFYLYWKFSKWAYTHCDKIAVSSKGFISYLNDVHGIEKAKIEYLPQHASDSLLYEDLTKTESDGIVDFYFAGNLGFGARLDVIIKAASVLRDRGYKFRVNFVGEGSDKKRLQKMVKDEHLNEYVLFHDPVSMQQMAEVYKKADALLVTLRKGQTTIPSKIQAYMATGKPIIAALDGSGRDVIEEAGCGICCPAEDVSQMADILMEYIKAPEKYCDYGRRGRIFFENNFTLNRYIEKLEILLSDLS